MARRIIGALALVAFATVSGQELIRNRTAEGFNNTPGLEVSTPHCDTAPAMSAEAVGMTLHDMT